MKVTFVTGCLDEEEDEDDAVQVHQCEQRQPERDEGWKARI